MQHFYLIAIFLLCIYKAELQSSDEETDVPDEEGDYDLTDEDFENAENFIEVPDENRDFQPLDDIIRDDEPTTEFAKRQAVSNRSKLWPNGKVPYRIRGAFGKRKRKVIAKAILTFNRSTCVEWVRRTDEPDFVVFEVSNNNCSSNKGRHGGRQTLFLDPLNCIWGESILHEMMHAIGFGHEHTRPDREKHVKIIYNNLLATTRLVNFDIDYSTDNLGDYDFNSLMHYQNWIGGNRSTITIKALNYEGYMGCIDGTFSQLDLWKIRKLYGC